MSVKEKISEECLENYLKLFFPDEEDAYKFVMMLLSAQDIKEPWFVFFQNNKRSFLLELHEKLTNFAKIQLEDLSKVKEDFALIEDIKKDSKIDTSIMEKLISEKTRCKFLFNSKLRPLIVGEYWNNIAAYKFKEIEDPEFVKDPSLRKQMLTSKIVKELYLKVLSKYRKILKEEYDDNLEKAMVSSSNVVKESIKYRCECLDRYESLFN